MIGPSSSSYILNLTHLMLGGKMDFFFRRTLTPETRVSAAPTHQMIILTRTHQFPSRSEFLLFLSYYYLSDINIYSNPPIPLQVRVNINSNPPIPLQVRVNINSDPPIPLQGRVSAISILLLSIRY